MDKETNDAAGKVSEFASNVGRDVMNSGSEYYREGSRAIASKVQEQPLGSLVIAAVIGFVLALVLSK